MDAHETQPHHGSDDDGDHNLSHGIVSLFRSRLAGCLIGSFDRPHNGIDPSGDSSRQVSGPKPGHDVIPDNLS
jgi:hypothetical protein